MTTGGDYWVTGDNSCRPWGTYPERLPAAALTPPILLGPPPEGARGGLALAGRLTGLCHAGVHLYTLSRTTIFRRCGKDLPAIQEN